MLVVLSEAAFNVNVQVDIFDSVTNQWTYSNMPGGVTLAVAPETGDLAGGAMGVVIIQSGGY